MKKARNGIRTGALATTLSTVLLACILLPGAFKAGGQEISEKHWGLITAPVYGTHESGVYSAAELFAGPNKFGSYYAGVLPNGSIVKPAGISVQVGMNPLGAALTPDGKFLVTTNDDEREGGFVSYQNPTNLGSYSLSVIDTSNMTVVSQINTAGTFFIGLVVTGKGPYTVWASGGPSNDVKLFNISTLGTVSVATPAHITIAPILPSNKGYVSNYTPDVALNTADGSGNKPPVPSAFSRTTGAQITFPAGSALSQDGKFLYVACNGDNSVAVIDTTLLQVVRQVPVGYFPYTVSVSQSGESVFVSNWGITEYKFAKPTYDPMTGKLTAVGTTGSNQPDGFYVPVTSTMDSNPQTSSVSILSAPRGNGAQLSLQDSVYEGQELDDLFKVGDTHPSATAIIHRGSREVVYVAKSNSDSLGIIRVSKGKGSASNGDSLLDDACDEHENSGICKFHDFDLSPIHLELEDGHKVHGAYPNALAVSPDQDRLYVAEAGINSVDVLDIHNSLHPRLLGRIPTGWYPTGLAISSDGQFLYITNAKGIGEDINPKTNTTTGNPPPSGLVSDPSTDSNFIYGSVQQVNLETTRFDRDDVLENNFAIHKTGDTSIVPVGGGPSKRIKHVFFILHENKTFDSMLGNLGSQFGPYASLTYNDRSGTPYTNGQFTGVSINTQTLAKTFATAGNYYSDSEESDAGHQFCASGTATDYTEKTLLVKSGRGLLVNKNFEPEDYPEGGYIFNNAARHGISFKDYGALIRIEGTDTGTSTPTQLNDLLSGLAGFPQLQADKFNVTLPLVDLGDVNTSTQGLGQSYFMKLPIVAVLGGFNSNGEPRLDRNYPGYNFNISDQRRAQEFIKDFDRIVGAGTLPEFIYLYQPNDHTGGIQAPNSSVVGGSAVQEVADGDVGLGMVIKHIMKSPVYYNADTGEGSAIFITYDDAQSTLDHIHPHRTPLIVVSPYAKPGYLGLRHYITASVVKTEELLLGLPPNNLGDLFATDLRDLFQPKYNGITAATVGVTRTAQYVPSPEGRRVWALVNQLDLSAPDRDSFRLGALTRLSMYADQLHQAAAKSHRLQTASYKSRQATIFETALRVVKEGTPRDLDD